MKKAIADLHLMTLEFPPKQDTKPTYNSCPYIPAAAQITRPKSNKKTSIIPKSRSQILQARKLKEKLLHKIESPLSKRQFTKKIIESVNLSLLSVESLINDDVDNENVNNNTNQDYLDVDLLTNHHTTHVTNPTEHSPKVTFRDLRIEKDNEISFIIDQAIAVVEEGGEGEREGRDGSSKKLNHQKAHDNLPELSSRNDLGRNSQSFLYGSCSPNKILYQSSFVLNLDDCKTIQDEKHKAKKGIVEMKKGKKTKKFMSVEKCNTSQKTILINESAISDLSFLKRKDLQNLESKESKKYHHLLGKISKQDEDNSRKALNKVFIDYPVKKNLDSKEANYLPPINSTEKKAQSIPTKNNLKLPSPYRILALQKQHQDIKSENYVISSSPEYIAFEVMAINGKYSKIPTFK